MTAVVVTGIIAGTVFKLALVGAGVKLAPPVLARLGITNTKPRQATPEVARIVVEAEPAVVAQAIGEAGK